MFSIFQSIPQYAQDDTLTLPDLAIMGNKVLWRTSLRQFEIPEFVSDLQAKASDKNPKNHSLP